MKTKLIYALCAFCIGFFAISVCSAQENSDTVISKYHRSSLYTVILEHPGYVFGNEIKQEFFNIPLPDKYDNHNLSVRSFLTDDSKDQRVNIELLLDRNYVSKRLVSKWFDRNKQTGAFDMNRISQRGFYDATIMDYNIARKTVRGTSMLADAGEELIGNTFVVVNDIQYNDKEKSAKKTKVWLDVVSAVASGVAEASSGDTKKLSENISSLAKTGSEISDLIAGFSVTITSYLYRLEWNENCSSPFYTNYYFDNKSLNSQKKMAFENEPNIFKLNYVGKYTVKSSKTVLRGANSNEEVIRKVCARALDENIVQLQKKFEPFKIKSPVYSVNGDTVLSPIGLKEGVTPRTKFEVLEKTMDANGKTHYERVGVVKPYRKCIWDNRFMAVEELAQNSKLNYTKFKKVRGGDFYPGMLLRQKDGFSFGYMFKRKYYDTIKFVLGGVALHPSQKSAFVMAGRVKKYGYYGKLKSDFSFGDDHSFEGKTNESAFFTGKEKGGRWAFTCGGMMRLAKPAILYIGGGYGNKWVNWETSSGSYVRMTDISYKGLETEVGLIFKIKKCVLSGGISATSFKYMEANIGFGVTL